MLARDTQELLDHLRWNRVHIVGLSMGGMIAQELVLLLPSQRIASLTLGNTLLIYVAHCCRRKLTAFAAVTHAGGRYAVALPITSGSIASLLSSAL